jgi:hypothetical protein
MDATMTTFFTSLQDEPRTPIIKRAITRTNRAHWRPAGGTEQDLPGREIRRRHPLHQRMARRAPGGHGLDGAMYGQQQHQPSICFPLSFLK